MRYGMIYLVVKDFQRSLDFYKKVLDMQVSETNGECALPEKTDKKLRQKTE